MFSRIARQAAAFSLATVLTLSILGSIDLLATQPAGQSLVAAQPAASQVAATAPASGG